MRRFPKPLGAVVVVAMLAITTGVAAGPASAISQSNSNPNNYLALGDSVSFGYNPLLVAPGVSPRVFVGFPQLASDLFRPRLKVFNASCPGETSTSLITGSRPDNGCQDYRQYIGALHVAYSGSQLSYAESYVKANPRTGLVTMMIGANDLFLLSDSCAGSPNPDACIFAGLPALLTTLSTQPHDRLHGTTPRRIQGDLCRRHLLLDQLQRSAHHWSGGCNRQHPCQRDPRLRWQSRGRLRGIPSGSGRVRR